MKPRSTTLRNEISRLLTQSSDHFSTPAAMFTAIADRLSGEGWPDDLLSERETEKTTTLPRSTRIDLIARHEFPKPFKLSARGRRVASRSLEIETWKVWRAIEAQSAA